MVQSVHRALALLEAVAGYDNWVGVRELARATRLKVPTAQNLLKTLAAHGFLEFDQESRRYRVGLAPLLLSEKLDAVARARGFARPYIEQLFREFKETVALCVMTGGRVVVADSLVSDEALTVIHPSRVIEHPHCLASGKMLLAHADMEFQKAYAASEPLADLGPNSPADVGSLLAELGRVKARGYAETVNVRGSGIGAVAVPVFGSGRRLAMALGCSAPLSRFDRARRGVVRRRLMETAEAMSKKLGA